MTIGELIERIRLYINDPQAVEYSEAELIHYINDVLKRIYLEGARLRALPFSSSTSVAVSAGAGSISLPSDFLKEEYVLWSDSDGKRYLVEDHPQDVSTSGRPEKYYKALSSLYFIPQPDRDGTVRISYYHIKTVQSSTDTFPLPSYFQGIVVHGVATKAKTRLDLNPEVDMRLEAYLNRQVRDYLKSYGAWRNYGKVRAP